VCPGSIFALRTVLLLAAYYAKLSRSTNET
jgi:hypothetical protein